MTLGSSRPPHEHIMGGQSIDSRGPRDFTQSRPLRGVAETRGDNTNPFARVLAHRSHRKLSSSIEVGGVSTQIIEQSIC